MCIFYSAHLDLFFLSLQDKIFYDHVVQPVLREDNEVGVRSLSQNEDKIKGSFSLISLFDSITYNKVKKYKILPVSCILRMNVIHGMFEK